MNTYYLLNPFIVFLLITITCTINADPTLDGYVSTAEYGSSSMLNDTTGYNYWYITWNANTLFTGWYTKSNYNNMFCFFETHPQDWRFDNYTAQGTSFVFTVIPGQTTSIPISADVLINCTLSSCIQKKWNSTYNVWDTVSAPSLVSASSSNATEFAIPIDVISRDSDMTYMSCYAMGVTGFLVGMNPTVYTYLGIPFGSNLPVSTKTLWSTFPSYTSQDGTWSGINNDAFLSQNAPTFNATNSDQNVIIQHDVTADEFVYATSLTVTSTGHLTIPVTSFLTVGLTCNTRTSYTQYIQISGAFTCNGTLRMLTTTTLDSSLATGLTIGTLILDQEIYGSNAMFLNAPITIVNRLQITSGVFIYASSPITYSNGSSLMYNPPTTSTAYHTVGQEWMTTSGALNTPYDVYIPNNVSVVLSPNYMDNRTYSIQNNLVVQGNFSFFSGSSILTVNSLQVYSGSYFMSQNVIQASQITIDGAATVSCSSQGSIQYMDGSPWQEFSVQLLGSQGYTLQVGNYSSQIVLNDKSVEISISGVSIASSSDISWYLNNVNYQQVDTTTVRVQSSGFLQVSIRTAPDYCWRTKQINLKLTSGNGGKKSNTMQAIIGIVAIVVALIIIAAIIVLVVRWRRNKKKKEGQDEELAMKNNDSKPPASKRESVRVKDDWEINYEDIRMGTQLGRGAFGVVYKAHWRNTECVVKQMDVSKQDDASIKLFLKEINNVKSVRVHPNVCMILGVCTDPKNPICIVMEYLSEGSLDNLIYNSIIPMDTKRVLQFSKDIASGMSHLHAENVLHCDLACRNILVSNKGNNSYILKIADFGLSKVTESSEYSVSSPNTQFPIRWSAPETLRAGKVSRASDVWSFGVVIWEMCEAKRPYPELTNTEVIKAVCDEGHRLPKPTKIVLPNEMEKLMRACWLDPQQRPSFDQIYQEICNIEEEYYPTTEKKVEPPSTFETTQTTTYSTQTNYGSARDYQSFSPPPKDTTTYVQMSTTPTQNQNDPKVNYANQSIYGNES